MAQLRFVMRSGPAVGKEFPLEAQEISIGRDGTNMVVINDAEVSRRHARMELRGSAYVIQDLGSTNGTFVNGIRLSGMQVLNPGDMVALGEGIMLAYESAVDLNMTSFSGKSSQTVVQRPVSAFPSTPAQPSISAPVYSGQVPAGPAPAGSVPVGQVPMPPEATPGKKVARKTVIIIAGVAVVLILCLCVGLPLIADSLKLDCVVPFKWFFNIIGPMFGYGLCP